jgi:hypothetical protein
MKTSAELVAGEETLPILVGKVILARGFSLASDSGIALYQPNCENFLGILYDDPGAKRTNRFCISGRRPRRRAFLGTIWFNSGVRGATKESWVLEAYGRKYAATVKNLADGLASTFRVRITLRLVCEHPVMETFMSDYDV